MSSIHSILKHAGPVNPHPFPHVVIHNALDYYADLAATRWGIHKIANGRPYGENQRLDVSAHVFLRLNPPAVWQEFIGYHVSQKFWEDVFDRFGPSIEAHYRAENLSRETETSMRFTRPTRVKMECQIGMNTPTGKASAVRGPHVDSTNELFGGMLYMPLPEDTFGGDLEIHELTGPPVFQGKADLLPGLSKHVATVPYKANTFVLFLSGLTSIHAVTPRQPTKMERRLVSFGIDLDSPLFTMPR